MKIRNSAIVAMTVGLVIAGIGTPAMAAQSQRHAVATNGDSQPSAAGRTSRNRADARNERRICVDLEMTGTRMKRRVCHTAAEWQEQGGLPTD